MSNSNLPSSNSHIMQSKPRLASQLLHLKPRPVHKCSRSIRPISIPRPLPSQTLLELAIEHLDNVLADNGKEFPAVEVAACGDVEALRCRVRGDDEVCTSQSGSILLYLLDRRRTASGCEGVPAYTIFVHLPVRALLAVEDVVCVVDVLFQSL